MTPEEYEHHVASILRSEGWTAEATRFTGDDGLDVIAEREGRRLGVQAKMFGGSNRPINADVVKLVYASAHLFDCAEAMIATNGRVLDSARAVAGKLGVEVRFIEISPGQLSAHSHDAHGRTASTLTFGEVWNLYVKPLVGTVVSRGNGKSNEILLVDDGGLVRRTSSGRSQRIDIEIFRWTIERLLDGRVVTREEINAQYAGRASSGIVLVLAAVPPFELTSVAGRQALRMRDGW